MYYGFDAHPLIYVAAALAIFGVPMACLFIAAIKSMGFNSHSQPPQQLNPPTLPRRVINLPATAVQIKSPKPVARKITRKRALRIEWVSLPVDQDKI